MVVLILTVEVSYCLFDIFLHNFEFEFEFKTRHRVLNSILSTVGVNTALYWLELWKLCIKNVYSFLPNVWTALTEIFAGLFQRK